MKISLPSETIFHTIERTIKAYRRYAQKNIAKTYSDISLDQGLTLMYLSKYPELAQHELADLLFKDTASLTRIINSMVKKKILKRSMNEQDRRRYSLTPTAHGKEIMDNLPSIIATNRKVALAGLSADEIEQLKLLLNKISTNCQL